ncbi:hypothetical protein EV194_105147 [Natronoflexus pectinivorans]|uniref:Uncharacterized protein n=2 Tax=Natronoflexus pectinivorans TaxID=682526 RepID=A0A4R2GJ61_9BACT|nr:hypothetical protein EV194_105147 [Natronoflexus pectinivorans]
MSHDEMRIVDGGSPMSQKIFFYLGKAARAIVDSHADALQNGMILL